MLGLTGGIVRSVVYPDPSSLGIWRWSRVDIPCGGDWLLGRSASSSLGGSGKYSGLLMTRTRLLDIGVDAVYILVGRYMTDQTPNVQRDLCLDDIYPWSSASRLRFMSRVTLCCADSCLASSTGTLDTGLLEISATSAHHDQYLKG